MLHIHTSIATSLTTHTDAVTHHNSPQLRNSTHSYSHRNITHNTHRRWDSPQLTTIEYGRPLGILSTCGRGGKADSTFTTGFTARKMVYVTDIRGRCWAICLICRQPAEIISNDGRHDPVQFLQVQLEPAVDLLGSADRRSWNNYVIKPSDRPKHQTLNIPVRLAQYVTKHSRSPVTAGGLYRKFV
jgi:hypothetical protein